MKSNFIFLLNTRQMSKGEGKIVVLKKATASLTKNRCGLGTL